MPATSDNKLQKLMGSARSALAVGLTIAAVALAGLTASRLRTGTDWLADAVTLFQPGVLIVSAIVGILSLITRSRMLIAVCGLVLAINLVITAGPAFHSAPPTEALGPRLTVATFNLLFDNQETGEVEAWARKASPDIIGVQEVTPTWATVLTNLSDVYPYSARVAAKRTWASPNLISRYPIKSATFRTVPGGKRMALTAILDVDGQEVSVSVVHAPTLRTRSQWMDRNAYLLDVAAWLNEGGGGERSPEGRPRIVMGDFNATRWSPHFQRFLAWTRLYDADKSWLPPPSRVLARPAGWAIGAPIDHVLTSGAVSPRGCRMGPDLGSDHLPLICDLQLPVSD